MYEDIKSVLIPQGEIEAKVRELAERINNDYRGKSVLMICILRGAVVFYAELIKRLNLDIRMDFMAVSSYGENSESSGEIKINKDLSQPIKGLDVIIVEDIIDSGRTLSNLKRLLATREPSSIKVCSLLDKPSRRVVEFEADYLGFVVPDEFVVGYGMDYAERYRNIPEVCILKPEVL